MTRSWKPPRRSAPAPVAGLAAFYLWSILRGALGRLDARWGGGRITPSRALGAGVAPVPSWFVQATRALADIARERHNRSEAQRLYTEYLRFVPSGSAAYNSAAMALSDMLHE